MTSANGSENQPRGRVPLEDMVDRIRDAHSTKPRETEEREYDPETGVVRVRKRRRVRKKSDQASVQAKKRRRLSLMGFGTVFVVAVLLAACYGMVWGTTKTDAFRNGFADSLIKQFGFRAVTSDRFSLNGSQISTGRVMIEGSAGSLLHRAQMSGFSMEFELDTFRGGDWKVRRCAASELKLFLVSSADEGVVDAQALPQLIAAGFLLNDNPEEIRIDEFSFWNTTFVFGADERKAESQVKQANLVFDRLDDGKGFAGHFGGGVFEIEGWPDLVVNKSTLRLENGVLDISNGSFSTRTGDLFFEGQLPTYGEGEFLIEAKNMRLAELLVDPWSVYADGVISRGEFVLKIDPMQPSKRSLKGDFKISTLRLFRMGFIQQVQTFLTRDDRGETVFQQVSGTLDHSSERTRIENLYIESTDGMVIRGTLEFLPDETMRGMLMVGVPANKFMEGMPRIFKIGEGGLAWTPIVLKGTGAAISDDLSERLANPPQEVKEEDFPSLETPDAGVTPPAPSGADLFEALTLPDGR